MSNRRLLIIMAAVIVTGVAALPIILGSDATDSAGAISLHPDVTKQHDGGRGSERHRGGDARSDANARGPEPSGDGDDDSSPADSEQGRAALADSAPSDDVPPAGSVAPGRGALSGDGGSSGGPSGGGGGSAGGGGGSDDDDDVRPGGGGGSDDGDDRPTGGGAGSDDDDDVLPGAGGGSDDDDDDRLGGVNGESDDEVDDD